jgi:hypothetical protein
MEAAHGNLDGCAADSGREQAVTLQFKPFTLEEMPPDHLSARLIEISRPSEIDTSSGLAEEFAELGEQVRIGLQNVGAHLIKAGHELRLIKQLPTRGEFGRQVSPSCGLSLRPARSMIRAADQALVASSMPQKAVASRPAQDEKLTPYVPKDLIRAVEKHKPTPKENYCEQDASALRRCCQPPDWQSESGRQEVVQLRVPKATAEMSLPTTSLIAACELETADVA